ncbi:MAG: electron transport complex subunit RsxC [Angelakisella sp.]|nr:electron transport complex subunit RsxC [Angelakisella sp.]
MPSLFSKALNGVSVKHCKNTANSAAVRMPVPDKVVIPMIQHMGAPCEPLVKVKDTVTVGQLLGDTDAFLSAPIHSSVSGTVTAIEEFITPGGDKCKSVVITTDKLQTPCPDLAPPVVNSREDLIKAVRACGLVGLGGAGFPTHIKLNPKNLADVDTLVINGAECEPFITCDMRLMLERTASIVDGIKVVMKYLELTACVIGIESNKPEAIAAMTEAVSGMENVRVLTMKALYPRGAEKVIIYEATGRVVEEGKLPADAGVIAMNVATISKLADYLKTGMPLVEKMLTVDGGAVAEPKNIIAPIGTAIKDMIAFCGGYKSEPKKLLMGGPMMGISVYSDDFPLLKNNNAILAFDEAQCRPVKESACIRCGRCLRACPFDLAPAAMDKAYHMGNVDKLRELKVNLCMECGCCSYVCPAHRELAMYNKLGKRLLREAK